jgi:pyruvate formate lyase activating enzyme
MQKNVNDIKGLVFDIKRDCSEDGPGIRTTVFFKGCPLSCVWCHNPEGISFEPSISFALDRCAPTECGGYVCLNVCPSNALKINGEKNVLEMNHAACVRCDKCFDLCTPNALEPVGQWWSMKELLASVLIDKKFFKTTGGGVTLSGGEATMQTDFLYHFLIELKKEEINIGLETCGMFDLAKFEKYILPYLDFIYFDLKLIDPQKSRRYTGCSNENILRNYLYLHDHCEIPVITRIPLIPDITATKSNLADMAYFLQKHGITACTLLPYNPLWYDKAIKNGIQIKYSHRGHMSQKSENNCVQYFLSTDPLQNS